MDTLFTIYLAPVGFTQELIHEIGPNIFDVRGQLVFVYGPPQHFAWAQNTWLNPRYIPIDSITDGAKKLSTLQRNWYLHSEHHHRRAMLIQSKLPYVSTKEILFGSTPPQSPLGSWTLWENNTILASPQCSSLFPDGVLTFHENKEDPPSRAYLKLWEVFTRFSITPRPGELCLDLGSAPGGWTWTLAQLGAHVFSIDKAPLAPHITSLPNVEHYIGSGFGLNPTNIGYVDWIFSDMICYPERLYTFVKLWVTNKHCHTMICTLKLQGTPDNHLLSLFKDIPHSCLVHLSHNKHELTWIYSNKYSLR